MRSRRQPLRGSEAGNPAGVIGAGPACRPRAGLACGRLGQRGSGGVPPSASTDDQDSSASAAPMIQAAATGRIERRTDTGGGLHQLGPLGSGTSPLWRCGMEQASLSVWRSQVLLNQTDTTSSPR